jgi:dihydrofolate reductase
MAWMDDLDTAEQELLAAARRGEEAAFERLVAGDPNFTPTHWEISRRDDEIDKVVVSDSISEAETHPWQATTRIVRRADAHQQVAELKRRDGKEILVFGSHLLWNDLLADGLVDELHLMVGAVVLGAGTPAFVGEPPVSLRLVEARKLDGSETLLVRYEVGPKAG